MTFARLNERPIPEAQGEIRLFGVVRNEALRLPYFLQYYRRLGVDRMFILDNGSDDGTVEILLSTPNVHVFRNASSYAASRCGIDWIHVLLLRYGVNSWCIVADADELLVYDGCEKRDIRDFCSSLEQEGSRALHCLLLDMYSDRALSDIGYQPGDDLLNACPFFDLDSIKYDGRHSHEYSSAPSFVGGMRHRLFGLNVCLDKISLLKFDVNLILHEGMHRISNAKLSSARGAMLHFKFLHDFEARAETECLRKEHWSDASEYMRYAQVMRNLSGLRPYGPQSRRLTSSNDLVRCGVLKPVDLPPAKVPK
jgi:glycosyltransferase involved in cell wall biosynthesis